jgi:hypothetical protein
VLKQDVSTLKDDVATLKQDVATLKQDVSMLQQQVSGVKAALTSAEIKIDGIEAVVVTVVDNMFTTKEWNDFINGSNTTAIRRLRSVLGNTP